jgi:hypothetical protein
MDIEKLMMYFIIFDMCNEQGDEQHAVVKSTTLKKKTTHNAITCDKARCNQHKTPKTKTFKRKL